MTSRLCLPGVVPDRLLDVQATYARQLVQGGARREDALARTQAEISGRLPTLLQVDPRLTVLRRVLDRALTSADSGELDGDEGCTWSCEEALLGPPVGRPHTIWGMMANYPQRRHDAASSVSPAPASPPEGYPRRNAQGCLKAPSSLAGPHDNLIYPNLSRQVDPEMELGVVIRSRARNPGLDSAMKAVAGYVGFCDAGARDVSALDNNRIDRAKGFDTFRGRANRWGG
ncbi:fumarylacetoacetate hydrolase family protein [Actinacidiphila soli]|uniref:fumarylacetoacetate hydrolase family protein n=1 Tax=Actinacidiphila soli TaxID=2487275 RepID=UPI000FCCD958|nr:fumarylacetoacetate hydrolase family protein [Actinacidiphila soli]